MGKVSISETKATKTARGGTKRPDGQSDKVRKSGERKAIARPVKVNAEARPKMNAGARPKILALPAGNMVVEAADVKATKPQKNIVVHDELDAGMALMADRSAASEYQKPDITKIKQQRGKSMNGMLIDVRSRVRPEQRLGGDWHAAAQDSEAKEAEAEKERFSRMGSTLIGVGVALVVAVIGFAAIAIFGSNKEKCTVDFESNGGTKIESTEIVCGRTVKQPSDPTKDGFVFTGWIHDGDPFDFSEAIYKNAVLVARWKANEDTEPVKVSFDTDGGSKIDPIEVAKGKTMHAPNDPTKAGGVFVAWYLDGKEFDFSTPIDKEITLKATWRKAQTQSSSGGSSNNNGNGGSSNPGGGNIFSDDNKTPNDRPNVDDPNNPPTITDPKPEDKEPEDPGEDDPGDDDNNNDDPCEDSDPGCTDGGETPGDDEDTEGDGGGSSGGDDNDACTQGSEQCTEEDD